MAGLKHFFHPRPIDSRDIGIHGLGIHEVMRPGIVNRVNGTDDYLLMYFYPACHVRDKTGYMPRPAGSFIVWTQDQAHQYGNPKIKWSHSWLHCGGMLVARWLKELRIPCNEVLSLSEPVVFERSLERIHAEAVGAFRPDARILRNLLENVFREVARGLVENHDEQIPPWLLETRAFLDAHFAEPVRLADLARRVHRAETWLCQQFRRYFHSSVIDYVIGLRMQRAAYLLQDHNLLISDIARQTGYEDVYHFSKLFKKRYGCSPKHLRDRRKVGISAS